MKLNIKALAIAAGLLWGAMTFLFGIWASFYTPAAHVVGFAGNFYLGYEAGFLGAVIGLVWGFADGAIGGLILAWLYNLLVGKFAAA